MVNKTGNYRRLFILLFGLICFLPGVAQSQIISQERIFGSYPQFVWQDQHGLPQNGISAVAQTPDGYLWLATAEGVVRFDGVNFTAFNTVNTPAIKSNNVQSLLVDHNGALWIGAYGGGVSRYQNGLFAHFSTAEGLSAPFVSCLFEDRAGNLWVGTDSGGLNLWQGGRFKVFTTKDGLPDNYIHTINQDATGELWVGAENGLTRYKEGKFAGFPEKDGFNGISINRIFRDSSGDLWVSSQNGLSRWHEGRFTSIGAGAGLALSGIQSCAQSRDGALWFGTYDAGLYRYRNGRFTVASTKDGLISNNIQAVFIDPTDNIWLGTSGGGLAELKNGKFTVYSKPEGLPGDMALAVYADDKGGVWVGAEAGLCRIKDGQVTALTLPDGNPLAGATAITQAQGHILISSRAGDKLVSYREGSSTLEIVRDNFYNNRVVVGLEDKAGNFWHSSSTDGLHRVERDGRATAFHKQDGLADEYINALYQDRAGSLWIGTRAGLSRFKDGALTLQEELAGRHILSFHEDQAGNLWIGTHGDGLFRFREGKFVSFTTKNGLYDNLAFQILEDDAGNLWMSGNKGIYRASLAELEDFAAGRRAAVNSFAYGSADGMLSRECNGASPAGARTQDGRLWFPTIKGVVVIDPKKTDERKPFVSLEHVLVDNKLLPGGQAVEMQPEQDDLEIQFTGLSWNRPAQIRFKYQLVGLDADWVEAGARRTAYYTHVPPGKYTFRVIADNGEGVWNNEGRSLAVVVLPPFYQTWWFYALCALTAGLLIRLLYNFRLVKLENINQAKTEFTRQLIASQEAERKRIAAELHDSIGQSLLIIKNRAYLGSLATDLAQAQSQLAEIGETAGEAVEEARDISHSLRPTQLERLGLTSSLKEMVNRIAATADTEFVAEIAPLEGAFTPEGEINFYRIVQEGLNNIIKHSAATRADLTVTRNEGHITLTLADNGQGFALEEAAGAQNRRRNFGLTGIGERIRLLNGTYALESAPGQGTTLRAVITSPESNNGK